MASRITPDREPEAWESGAAAPWATISGATGDVTITVLGNQRHRVQSPERVQEVEGHDAAVELAHRLAAEEG
jgi:hypothetical protein